MKRSKLQKAGWSALLVLSLLGCVELGVRVWVGSVPIEQIRLTYDAQLLWGLSEDRANNPDISVNSLGLRGPEVVEDARPRLISLGDSSIFGDRVTYAQTFTTVAQKALDAEGLRFQPIIGAIPGYSTAQALRQLDRLSYLKPAFVLIGTLWSDANQTNGETDRETMARVQESMVVRLGFGKLLDVATRWSVTISQLRLKLRPGEGKVGWIENGAAAPGPVQRSRVPLPEYRENLLLLIKTTRELGGTPILLMLPHPLEDQQQALASYYLDYRQTMREISAQENVPLVDGPAYFAAHPCGGCTRFADTIHPNNVGHALLGDALIDTLRPLLTKGMGAG